MNKKKKLIAVGVAVVVSVLYVFNMAYFSIKPDFFEVAHKADVPQGAVFADTLVMLINQELSGLGGWIPNDIPPSPSWFLDNRPNMQLGVLEAVRYSSRVLRDNLSRQRTTDTIDDDCDGAFTSFSNDPYKWIIPSAEGKYRKGIQSIESYGERLKYGNARFYPRSDNLIQLLEQYVSLLGGVNTRLLNATRRGGSGGSGAVAESKGKERERIIAEVPWYRIDDNFYLAQGVGYALFHLFKALRLDFGSVLKDKNAEVIMDDIIISLQEAYFEPLVITNGSKGGVFANHSSNLRVYLDDARQKANSLIKMLDQG